MEGWRAVLTVVLRYGMAQKQRIEYNFLAPQDQTAQDPEAMDVDNVKAMITGVKSRGVCMRVHSSLSALLKAGFRAKTFSSMSGVSLDESGVACFRHWLLILAGIQVFEILESRLTKVSMSKIYCNNFRRHTA